MSFAIFCLRINFSQSCSANVAWWYIYSWSLCMWLLSGKTKVTGAKMHVSLSCFDSNFSLHWPTNLKLHVLVCIYFIISRSRWDIRIMGSSWDQTTVNRHACGLPSTERQLYSTLFLSACAHCLSKSSVVVSGKCQWHDWPVTTLFDGM